MSKPTAEGCDEPATATFAARSDEPRTSPARQVWPSLTPLPFEAPPAPPPGASELPPACAADPDLTAHALHAPLASPRFARAEAK